MHPDIEYLKKIVKKLACNQGVHFVDAFYEEKTGSTIVFENGRVDRIRQGIDLRARHKSNQESTHLLCFF